jgi:hypothetical protein
VKIVVIGGSGLIGSKLVNKLQEHGHEAVSASPDSGVNTLTGEGLAEALEGAAAVVDVSNSRSFEGAEVLHFFETTTGNLLDAEAAEGVGHHVALSVVGTERLSESGYFRGKIAQEKLIQESSIPYSIVHATQFFEFVAAPFVTTRLSLFIFRSTNPMEAAGIEPAQDFNRRLSVSGKDRLACASVRECSLNGRSVCLLAVHEHGLGFVDGYNEALWWGLRDDSNILRPDAGADSGAGQCSGMHPVAARLRTRRRIAAIGRELP